MFHRRDCLRCNQWRAAARGRPGSGRPRGGRPGGGRRTGRTVRRLPPPPPRLRPLPGGRRRRLRRARRQPRAGRRLGAPLTVPADGHRARFPRPPGRRTPRARPRGPGARGRAGVLRGVRGPARAPGRTPRRRSRGARRVGPPGLPAAGRDRPRHLVHAGVDQRHRHLDPPVPAPLPGPLRRSPAALRRLRGPGEFAGGASWWWAGALRRSRCCPRWRRSARRPGSPGPRPSTTRGRSPPSTDARWSPRSRNGSGRACRCAAW